MGLAATGVMGIRLDEAAGALVVGMDTARADAELLLVTEEGLAKRTPIGQFPVQGRNGKGVLAWRSGGDTRVAGALVGQAEDKLVVHLSRAGAKSLRFGDAPRRTRSAIGKLVIEVKEKDSVVGLSPAQARLEAPPAEEKPAAKTTAASKGGGPGGKPVKARPQRGRQASKLEKAAAKKPKPRATPRGKRRPPGKTR